eukprot:gene5627-7771_t
MQFYLFTCFDFALWPSDALNCAYVGNWCYWYRPKGMKTSTDDVLVALVATTSNEQLKKIIEETNLPATCCEKNLQSNYEDLLQVSTYADFGCGIGSTLLLVANKLSNKALSIGIEVQSLSCQMIQRTICDLPQPQSSIKAYNMDIRNLTTQTLIDWKVKDGCFDLITANPPYTEYNIGKYCNDTQRKFARFSLHGCLEDYCYIASSVLSPKGRFIFSFPYNKINENRIHNSLISNKLIVNKRISVVAGSPSNTVPFLWIYDTSLSDDIENRSNHHFPMLQLNLVRNETTGGLNDRYKHIKSLLNMKSRPLNKRQYS